MNTTVESLDEVAAAAKLFCGFGDRTRLAIIAPLADGGQRGTGIVVALPSSQGYVVGDLRWLEDRGLVIDRRAGREAFYRIAHPEVVAVLRSAERLLAATGQRIDLCPNYENPGK